MDGTFTLIFGKSETTEDIMTKISALLQLQLLTLILGRSNYPVSRFGLYSTNQLS